MEASWVSRLTCMRVCWCVCERWNGRKWHHRTTCWIANGRVVAKELHEWTWGARRTVEEVKWIEVTQRAICPPGPMFENFAWRCVGWFWFNWEWNSCCSIIWNEESMIANMTRVEPNLSSQAPISLIHKIVALRQQWNDKLNLYQPPARPTECTWFSAEKKELLPLVLPFYAKTTTFHFCFEAIWNFLLNFHL